jgi:hypothetical protein
MPLHLVTPFDRTDPSEDEQPISHPVWTLRSRVADGCYILIRGCLFLGSSYLMALAAVLPTVVGRPPRCLLRPCRQSR